MKIVILAMLIVMSGCAMSKALQKTTIKVGPSVIDNIPKRDSHHWTSGREDKVWCENHQIWETISYTYKPSILSKLRYKEYEVETNN